MTRPHARGKSSGVRRPILAEATSKTPTHRDVSRRLSTVAFNQRLITNYLTPPCAVVFVSTKCIGACHTRLPSLTHRRARQAADTGRLHRNFHIKRCWPLHVVTRDAITSLFRFQDYRLPD
ncbi:hypothetical protein LSAT2_030596 [Lamellibrachia satsuma]|nr:hypothetical protein LSAT2_030596 [Lamellibrachia satsuma]